MDLIMDIAQINFPINDNDGAKLMAPLLIQKNYANNLAVAQPTTVPAHGLMSMANYTLSLLRLYKQPLKIILRIDCF